MKQFSPNGFTMIELLVAITIMLLLVGGSIAGFIRFNERQIVVTTAKELQVFLRSAQRKAQVKEIPSGCNTLQAYRVSGTGGINGTSIEMVARCGPGIYSLTDHTSARSTLTLPNNVSLGGNLDVQFFTLHGGVSGSGVVTVESDNFTYEFEITQGGEITDGEIVE